MLAGGKFAPIESLKPGDEVLSFIESGAVVASKVSALHRHPDPQALIKVRFWHGSVVVTPNHWVLNQYGTFAEAGTMRTDDALVDALGHLRPIIGVEELPPEPVYNITVDPHHTFICYGVRVHNGGLGLRYPVIEGGGGGGGKGGGGGHTPVEEPNTLRSKATAKLIDLISEGEIVGLLNGAKSIFYDGTPLQNPDDSYNFKGVVWEERKGLHDQTVIAGMSDVESEIVVGVEVKNATPAVRTISDNDVDAVRVTLRIPALFFQDPSNGDMRGTSVQVAIDVQASGGGYVEVVNETITGKTTSTYERAWRIELTGSAPWNVRMRRVSADFVGANHQGQTWFTRYTAIIDHHLTYPDCAMVGQAVDSQLFGGTIPRRGYEVNGLKIKVPTNYNPVTRVYDPPIWDGTFKVAWTNNPAWVLYDIITNSRYGLGDYVSTSMADKWSLYVIGQYCDVLVDDGFGGTEPRFTFNGVLMSAEDAVRVLQSIAAAFRGMVYWSSGSITAVQDSPSTPLKVVNNTNVLDGMFAYAGTARKARHTVAAVTWNNPLLGYKRDIEVVEDQDGLARYGDRLVQVVLLGCTSRSMARRYGRWLLLTEQLETETVSYKVQFDHLDVMPGAVIEVYDQHYAGVRNGGRLLDYLANLLLYSEQFQQATWTKSNLTVSPDALNAPTGAATADRLVEAATTTVHRTEQQTAKAALAQRFTFSVHLRSAERTRAYVVLYGTSDANRAEARVDLSTGALDHVRTFGTFDEPMAFASDAGGGWWRVQLTAKTTADAVLNCRVALTDGVGADSSATYAGDAAKGLSVWGAHLLEGSDLRTYTASAGVLPESAVLVDDPVVVSGGQTYTMSCELVDGTVSDLPINEPPGSYTTVQMLGRFPLTPRIHGLWGVTSTSVNPRTFRVVAIRESERGVYEVTALLHNPNKFSESEADVVFDTPSFTVVSGPLSKPSDLTTVETLYREGPAVLSAVTLSWTASSDPRVFRYEVEYMRPNEDTWYPAGITERVSMNIVGTFAGTWGFRVRALDRTSMPSAWETRASVGLLGMSAPPADVQDFNVSAVGTVAHLGWSPVGDLDLSHYQIRHDPSVTGASWSTSILMIDRVSRSATGMAVPAYRGTYLIKAVDLSGSESVNAALTVSNTSSLDSFNAVEAVVEEPAWAGVKTNTIKVGAELTLAADNFMSDWVALSDVVNLVIGVGGLEPEGGYEFDNVIDLGAPYTTARLIPRVDAYGENVLNVMSGWLALSDVRTLDGLDPGDWDVEFYVSTTDDDTTGSPTWTPFSIASISDYAGRGFRFKLLLFSEKPYVNIHVTIAEATVDMDDRVASGLNLVATVAGLRVDFAPSFHSLQALAFNDENMATGDYRVVTNKSKTGFDVLYKNAAGSPVQRQFDYVAKGYGYEAV
jgi:predicted phage tail protein